MEPDDRHDPDLELPIKLGPCSNGEFLPVPLSAVEREVIRTTREEADSQARRLGIPRRTFLRSVAGAALMLRVLDDVDRRARGGHRGGRFNIPAEGTSDIDAARDAVGGNEFIFDVQTHFLNFDLSRPGDLGFGRMFPQERCGENDPRACFSVEHYMQEMFLKSDTDMMVISAVPIPGDANPLSIDDMELAKKVITSLCGHRRVLLHGQAFPQIGSLQAALDGMDQVREAHKIAAWKLYTHLPGPGFWLDDHQKDAPQVGNAFLDKVSKTGIKTLCVHKGFAFTGSRFASPEDIGPAAKAHPDIKFVVYHSGYDTTYGPEGPFTEQTADVGVNRLVKTLRDNGIKPGGNVYAELGGTWWVVMRRPTQAAHVLGKVIKAVGENNVLWGTDSIWFGTPQDQIQAFRSFEITPEFQDKYGYPELTPTLKQKILGKNAARLYRVKKPVRDKCHFSPDEVEHARQALPSPNRTYGPQSAAAMRAYLRDHGVV